MFHFEDSVSFPVQVQRLSKKYLAKRIGAGFLLLAALVLAGAAAWLIAAARLALPQLDGKRTVPGLNSQVTVLRDRQGVPTITAASLSDLFFAQGYVTAQDRLWQMDMTRRYAAGELSEVMGGRYIKLDTTQRILGLRHVADTEAAQLSARDREYLEAYAQGVNAYISAHRHSLPLEFRVLGYFPRAWTPADSLLVGTMMAEMLNHYGYRDVLEREKIAAKLGPELAADLFPSTSGRDILPDGQRPFDAPDDSGEPEASQPKAHENHARHRHAAASTVRHFHHRADADVSFKPELAAASTVRRSLHQDAADINFDPELVPGSNNWVVAGIHTASGKPLLANDMHLPHRIPNTWYEIHLTSGDYDVAGVSLPGLPAVIVGHNQRIAWGFTNLGPDVEDLYVETFNDKGEYLTPEGWRRPDVRHEIIRVKGGREIPLDVLVTRHGPIITPALKLTPAFKDENRQLALRWTLYDSAGVSFPFFDLNMARNWDEFRQALSHMSSPGQNVVYADVDGHIGYQATGLVPIRAAGDGLAPMNGSEDHEWKGYIPFDQMPRLYDPPSGIIATANQRVTADDYPYAIATDWGAPYRAERIHNMLRADKQFNAADMLALQNDIYSDADKFFAERFVYALDHWPKTSPRARQAAELLRRWDGRMSADSAAAAIERHARRDLYQALLTSKLGDDADQYAWFNAGEWLESTVLGELPRWLPAGYSSYDELLSAMVEKAVSDSRAPRNLASWRYGDDFPVEIEHPIFGKIPFLKRWAGPGRRPQAGDSDTVKQVGRDFGPSQRLTVDLANLDSSTLNIVNGQSGNLFSPYFNDQWKAWYTGTTFDFPFTPQAVQRGAAHRLLLEP